MQLVSGAFSLLVITYCILSLSSRCVISLSGPSWSLRPVLHWRQAGLCGELSSYCNTRPAAGYLRRWLWQLWCWLAVRPDCTVRLSVLHMRSRWFKSQSQSLSCCWSNFSSLWYCQHYYSPHDRSKRHYQGWYFNKVVCISQKKKQWRRRLISLLVRVGRVMLWVKNTVINTYLNFKYAVLTNGESFCHASSIE